MTFSAPGRWMRSRLEAVMTTGTTTVCPQCGFDWNLPDEVVIDTVLNVSSSYGLTPADPDGSAPGVHDQRAAAAAADRLGRCEHESVPEELEPGHRSDLRVHRELLAVRVLQALADP